MTNFLAVLCKTTKLERYKFIYLNRSQQLAYHHVWWYVITIIPFLSRSVFGALTGLLPFLARRYDAQGCRGRFEFFVVIIVSLIAVDVFLATVLSSLFFTKIPRLRAQRSFRLRKPSFSTSLLFKLVEDFFLPFVYSAHHSPFSTRSSLRAFCWIIFWHLKA